MKHTLLTLAIAAGSLAVPFATMHAQVMDDLYQIPFAFNAEGQEFAAGRYIVHNTGGPAKSINSAGGLGVQFLAGTLSAQPRRAHLTFDKIGDKYFLRQVWNEDGLGSRVPMGAQEREIIAHREQAKVTHPEVSILAKR